MGSHAIGAARSAQLRRPARLHRLYRARSVEGLRRQYSRLELVFVAHTIKAWEFPEGEFFQVRGSGGTVASSAFSLVEEIVGQRYDPSRYNIYLFYGSDGENFKDDHDAAETSLGRLADVASYIGYVETPATAEHALETETAGIFKTVLADGCPGGSYPLTTNESVWDAIRAFFREQVAAEP